MSLPHSMCKNKFKFYQNSACENVKQYDNHIGEYLYDTGVRKGFFFLLLKFIMHLLWELL